MAWQPTETHAPSAEVAPALIGAGETVGATVAWVRCAENLWARRRDQQRVGYSAGCPGHETGCIGGRPLKSGAAAFQAVHRALS